MSEERKEYPFEKTFDVKFDESALKTFNDLIKEKGIRHFKLESDLYGILDVVSYEEYEKLQQKVEQLENIRKEAIEYVLKNKLYRFKYDDEELFEITTDKKAKDDLLNILNKGSDKE